MIPPVQFAVIGSPAPQGSHVPFKDKQGHARIKESAKGLGPWRNAVSAAAREQHELLGATMSGPLKLTAQFRLPMPKSRPVWMRQQGIGLCEVKPDLSKLVRAVEDAMKTGGLIADDSLIAVERLSKIEVWDGWTGVVLRVQMLDPRAFKTELL